MTRRERYEEIDAMNASTLVHGLKSMRSLRRRLPHPVEDGVCTECGRRANRAGVCPDAVDGSERTPGMMFGSHYHCLILEPDDFRKKHRVMPNFAKSPDNRKADGTPSKSSTGWSKQKVIDFAIEAEADGVEVISRDNYNRALRMIDALKEDVRARELMKHAKREQTLLGEILGVPFKGRVDLQDATHTKTHSDIKGTVSVEEVAFGIAMANQHTKFKMAIYRELFRQNGIDVREHHLIAVESAGDFDVCCYEIPEAALDDGYRQVLEVVRAYKLSRESGQWPGFNSGVKCSLPLFIPNWDMPEDGGDGLQWGDIEPAGPMQHPDDWTPERMEGK